MTSGSNTQAVMLLTVSFGKSDGSKVKPLSTKEWARFATWLRSRNLEVSDLLTGDLRSQLCGWTDRSITLSRLESLFDRGGALGLALEKWQRAGLWIMTQWDPGYPERFETPAWTGIPTRALRLRKQNAPCGRRHRRRWLSRRGQGRSRFCGKYRRCRRCTGILDRIGRRSRGGPERHVERPEVRGHGNRRCGR